jgi:hypothetical protein
MFVTPTENSYFAPVGASFDPRRELCPLGPYRAEDPPLLLKSNFSSLGVIEEGNITTRGQVHPQARTLVKMASVASRSVAANISQEKNLSVICH